ncbi:MULTISPECIES: ABC transporter permease [unclassified Pseudoalteromonas]|uniref:ABC transporter permease n=1 Tax=unclassified Pseudoalteromonas TaxID=194690 RepID=UPI0005AB3518|nr:MULTISPECIES: ABC transporter permease [unclassified Pseudoalteromonas]
MTQHNKTWLVAKWEFMHFFKIKQELIGKAVMLLIALMVFFWHNSQGLSSEKYQVAVISQSPLIGEFDLFEFKKASEPEVVLKEQLNNELIDAILVEQMVDKGITTFKLYSVGKHSWQKDLSNVLTTYYSAKVTQSLGLTQQQLQQIKNPIFIENHYLDTKIKSEEHTSRETAVGVLILIGLGIFVSFAQIFVSITGEKQQRVTEQLYACMDSQTWIDGKILGQMLLALKAMTSTLISIVLGFGFFQVILNGQTFDLSFIDWFLLPWFLLFSILGLYLATAFMAAIAAAIDDPNHSGKTSFMMLPLVPMILTFMVMDSPSGLAMTVLSYFPLTAFAAMPVKMALIEVPMWQTLLAITSTGITCWYARRLAGKMFKMGMIMYGKEPGYKEMFKWAVS